MFQSQIMQASCTMKHVRHRLASHRIPLYLTLRNLQDLQSKCKHWLHPRRILQNTYSQPPPTFVIKTGSQSQNSLTPRLAHRANATHPNLFRPLTNLELGPVSTCFAHNLFRNNIIVHRSHILHKNPSRNVLAAKSTRMPLRNSQINQRPALLTFVNVQSHRHAPNPQSRSERISCLTSPAISGISSSLVVVVTESSCTSSRSWTDRHIIYFSTSVCTCNTSEYEMLLCLFNGAFLSGIFSTVVSS